SPLSVSVKTSWLLGSFAGPPSVQAVSVCETTSPPFVVTATKFTSWPCDVTPKSWVLPSGIANWNGSRAPSTTSGPSAPNDTNPATDPTATAVAPGSLPAPNKSPGLSNLSAPSSTAPDCVMLASCTGTSSTTLTVKSPE